MAVKGKLNNEGGQAVLEYLLLLFVVISAYMLLLAGLKQADFLTKLLRPIREDFARTYQYGHPRAKGFDDGGPENHPRANGGNGNFRIFISPDAK